MWPQRFKVELGTTLILKSDFLWVLCRMPNEQCSRGWHTYGFFSCHLWDRFSVSPASWDLLPLATATLPLERCFAGSTGKSSSSFAFTLGPGQYPTHGWKEPNEDNGLAHSTFYFWPQQRSSLLFWAVSKEERAEDWKSFRYHNCSVSPVSGRSTRISTFWWEEQWTQCKGYSLLYLTTTPTFKLGWYFTELYKLCIWSINYFIPGFSMHDIFCVSQIYSLCAFLVLFLQEKS